MSNVVNFDLGQVLSGRPSGVMVQGWDTANEYVPAPKDGYVYPTWVQDIVVWLRTKENLYIVGPTGCGKTSALKNIMSMFNYPVYEITGHSRLEFPEMVGHPVILKDKTMGFEYGPLSKAMKGGGLFLLNEIDLLAPDTLAGLNSILDGSPLCIPENGGELIKPHPMFRFAATANSNGSGDETGQYQGVLRMNMAAMDRFMLILADYLTEQQETDLLAKQYGTLPVELRVVIVRIANACRLLFKGTEAEGIRNSIELTFSTRTVLRTAQFCTLYEPLSRQGVDVLWYALQRAVFFRASMGTMVTLKELYQRITGRTV